MAYGAINSTAARTQIGILLCPSDSDRLASPEGHTNYMGNAGSAPNAFYGNGGTSLGSVGPCSGVFVFAGPDNGQPRIVLGFRNVVDGLSQTAAFCERVKGVGKANDDRFDTTTPTSSAVEVPLATPDDRPSVLYATCKGMGPPSGGHLIASEAQGANWTLGYAPDTRYNHVMPPNTWNCAGGNAVGIYGAYAASSRHNGLVNVLMCDGSVRPVRETIALPVWWALGSRAHGEVVSGDGF